MGAAGWPGPPLCWRRARIITTAAEIAASAMIAIRIGSRGEEPSSSAEDAGTAAWSSSCAAALPVEPVSGLLCPVPPSLSVGALARDEDGLSVEDLSPEPRESVLPDESGAEAPPSSSEDCAGVGLWAEPVEGLFPVTVGGASEY